ncbi:MAG: hypothetical protein ACOX3U_04685 [Christensenellales bacterium]|jgi:hypothetical protein
MSKGRLIALSAISSAFAVIFAVIGGYFNNLTFTFMTLSSVSISIPLIMNSIKSAALSYVAASILIFIIIPSKALLFIVFFGLFPLVNEVLIKTPFILRYIIKLLYFIAAMTLIYFFTKVFSGLKIVEDIGVIKFLALYYIVGLILLHLYNFAYNRYVISILKSKFSRVS